MGDTAFGMISDVADACGLGPLDGVSLAELQSRTNTRVNTQKHMYHRGLGGSCPAAPKLGRASANLELLLQMIHLKLRSGGQQLKPAALHRAIERAAEFLPTEATGRSEKADRLTRKTKRHLKAKQQQQQPRSAEEPENKNVPSQQKDPEARFMEKVTRELYMGGQKGRVPHFEPLSVENVKSVRIEDVQFLHEAAFTRRPHDFRFVFVGDLRLRSSDSALDSSAGFSMQRSENGDAGDCCRLDGLDAGKKAKSGVDQAANELSETELVALLQRYLGTLSTSSAPRILRCGDDDGDSSTLPMSEFNDEGIQHEHLRLINVDAPGFLKQHCWVLRSCEPCWEPAPAVAVPAQLDIIFPTSPISFVQHGYLSERASVILLFPSTEIGRLDPLKTHLCQTACAVLRTRLLQVLRQQLSKLYSVSVDFSQRSLAPYGVLSISFACAPENAHMLATVALRQLEAMVTSQSTEPEEYTVETLDTMPCITEVTAEELHAVRGIGLKQHAQRIEDNSSWLFWLLDAQKHLDFVRANQVLGTSIDATADALHISHLVLQRVQGPHTQLQQLSQTDIRKTLALYIQRNRPRVQAILMPKGRDAARYEARI